MEKAQLILWWQKFWYTVKWGKKSLRNTFCDANIYTDMILSKNKNKNKK